jgi:rubrerythrin
MKDPTDMGTNRTGIAASPVDARRMIEGAAAGTPDGAVDLEPLEPSTARIEWSRSAAPLGTMPTPATLKGAARSAVAALKGEHAGAFLDQLAARLAFERTGTRLYEALLVKYEAAHVHQGGPTREELEEIRDEELEHAAMLAECIETLGADPTAVTPAANVQAVAGHGILQVVADPRTTLSQALEAVLIAELADNDAWQLLHDLAEGMGQHELAEQFRHAQSHEEEHLARVRRWVSAALRGQAGIQPTPRREEREAPRTRH